MMLARLEIDDERLESLLGRTSPLTKLAIALAWLVGLATTSAFLPPLVLTGVALGAGLVVGGIRVGVLAGALAPLGLAALGIGLSNAVFGAANADPTSTTVLTIGPLPITAEALAGALALMLRVTAIASVGAVFTLTTDATRLADALVQQARLSPRFAFGALAAYQAIPRFGEDLTTLRQARRIRGLRGSWHPRLLLGLLVLAIRHADRVALAMEARALGHGPRTHFRTVRWGWRDFAVGLTGLAILVAALRLGQLA